MGHAFGVEIVSPRRGISIEAQGNALGYGEPRIRSLKGCSMYPEIIDEHRIRERCRQA